MPIAHAFKILIQGVVLAALGMIPFRSLARKTLVPYAPL